MRTKPNILATAAFLMVPAVAAWALIIYTCHTIVAGAAVVLELLSRSL